jgi:hypothetical protein
MELFEKADIDLFKSMPEEVRYSVAMTVLGEYALKGGLDPESVLTLQRELIGFFSNYGPKDANGGSGPLKGVEDADEGQEETE